MNDIQPTLFPALVRANVAPGASLEEQFAAFHDANPHVYAALVRLARNLRRMGIRRYGIAALFEALRYEAAVQTGGDDFKLNNNHRAYYARRIMDNEKDLRGFFELRTQRCRSKTL